MIKKFLAISLLFATLFSLTSCMHEHEYSNGICDCGEKDPIFAEKYEQANQYIEKGKYDDAYKILIELGDFIDSKSKLDHFKYVPKKIKYNDTYMGEYSIEIFYNEDNLPIQRILSNPKLGQSIYVYQYDSLGKLINDEITFYQGNKSAHEYIYDENNNLIKEISISNDGSKYTLDYFYNSSGKLIKRTETSSDGSQGFWDYTYDAYGNLIKMVSNHIIWDYTYDENGNLVKEVRTLYRGIDRLDYTYDANGNLFKKVRYESDGDITIWDYTYDENSNLIREVYTNAKGEQEMAEIEYVLVYIPYELTKKLEEILSTDNYYFLS